MVQSILFYWQKNKMRIAGKRPVIFERNEYGELICTGHDPNYQNILDTYTVTTYRTF